MEAGVAYDIPHLQEVWAHIQQHKAEADEFEQLMIREVGSGVDVKHQCLTCGPESTDHPSRLHNGYRVYIAEMHTEQGSNLYHPETDVPDGIDFSFGQTNKTLRSNRNKLDYVITMDEMFKLFDAELQRRRDKKEN